MTGLAEVAIVLTGSIGGDNLALGAGKRVGSAEQKLGQRAQGPGCFRTEGERAGDSGKSFGERDVGHWILLGLSSDLDWLGLGQDGGELRFAALKFIAGQRKHQQAWQEG